MTESIKAALRAAVFAAISALGESKTREIIGECFALNDKDHWGR